MRLRRAATLLTIILISVTTAFTTAQSRQVQLINKLISLKFAPSDGHLVELTDIATQTNFVETGAEPTPLWTIDFMPGTSPAGITAAFAKSFRSEPFRRGGQPALRLVWTNFGIPSAKRLRVEATVQLEAKIPNSRWKINITGLGSLRIEKVRFPRVAYIRRQDNERLAVPQWMGELTKDPRAAINSRPGGQRRLEWPYPGTLSMQCLAFYKENGPGLYLASNDTASYRKAFAFWGNASRQIGCELLHNPENIEPPRKYYSPGYDAVLGTFSGDWFTAAERYREWGTKQEWATGSRLNRGLVPDWLLKTGFWVWNRGKSEGVLKPAQILHQAMEIPVSIFWHWWHGCAYDTGFPEYLPPREGTGPFKEAVADAHKEGVKLIVYMNQRLWGMTTKSWTEKGADKYAVKGLDGKIRPEIYNTYTMQPTATMCIATSFWRDTYAGIAEEAVIDLDVDGIYMDQACSSLLCYDPVHGHPLGGGTFLVNGFRMLSNDIRQRTAETKKVLLAGEGSGEAWLPYLDLMLTLQVSRERYAQPGDGWQVIPFFQSVYHDCGVTYGNYSSLTIPPYDELWPAEFAPKEPLELLDRKYASQFYLEQARTFAWGSQPTLANFLPPQLEQRKEEMEYLMKLARVRYNHLQYLLHGRFLRPPQIKLPEVRMEISRLSIYAGRRGKSIPPQRQAASKGEGVSDSTEGLAAQGWISTPPVIASAWQAKDGSTGIIFASILDQPVAFDLDLRPYGKKGASDAIFVDESLKKKPLRSSDSSTVRIDLGARSAGVLVLR